MSTIVHFDVPAEDTSRAKNFYEKLFNWKIEPVPGPMEYFHILTKDDKGNEAVGGGMGQRGQPDQKITNYIGVESIEEYIKKVEELGGKILIPKTTIPGFGYLATFLDTEENVLGLWHTDESAKM